MRARLVLIATAALVLCGCAADRVSGVPPRTPVASAPASAAAPCTFSIESLKDERADDGLGSLGRTKVSGDGFMPWLNDRLAQLPGHVDQHGDVAVRIDLLKAYVQAIYSLKSANIVVRVEVAKAGGPAVSSKTLRGVEGSTNWNSTESEVQAAFEGAWSDLRPQVEDQLRGACGRKG
jgi:hypothetical protein